MKRHTVTLLLAFFLVLTGNSLLNGMQAGPENDISILTVNTPYYKEGKNLLQIFVMIPYSKLKFTRIQPGYEADYEFSIEISGDSPDQANHRYWNSRKEVSNYLQTRSQDDYFYGSAAFVVNPGKHTVFFEATDRNTGQSVSRSVEKDLENFWNSDVRLSEFYFFDGRITGNEDVKFYTPRNMVSADFYTGFTVFTKFFSKYGTDSLTIRWEIKSAFDEQFTGYSQTKEAKVTNYTGSERLFFSGTSFPPGIYELEMEIQSAKGGHDNIKNTFQVFWKNRPFEDRKIRTVFKQMQIIPSFKREHSGWGSLSDTELKEKINTYWDDCEPDPNTNKSGLRNEYFSRVDIAVQQFSTWNLPGWESDRGRIFILYGQPFSIEKFYNIPGNPPREQWVYNSIDRIFYFIDTDRNGIFRLAQKTDRAGNKVF